jgi:hypothetical protein
MTTEVGSELEATAELDLGAGEVALVDKGGRDSKVALGHERSVVDLLCGGDGGSQTLDRVVLPALVIAHKGGEHERDPGLQCRIVGQARQPLRLGEPLGRVRCSPLPLVDVTEQKHRLALDVSTAKPPRAFRHLEQLVGRFLQLPQHHGHVRPAHAKLELQLLLDLAEHI